MYEVLERFAGVRWVWPGELGTHVPETGRLVIEGPLDERHGPALGFRSFGWNGLGNAAFRDWYSDTEKRRRQAGCASACRS